MTGYGKQVLIADDEELIGRFFAEYLTARQFAVTVVTDGLQALRELHHRHFDAVITDLHLPYLDGLDLLCQCHLVWPQLPVILISGNLFDVIGSAMAKGAYACLPKPVDPAHLIHVLKEAIPHTLLPMETASLNRDPPRSLAERRFSHAYHHHDGHECVVERVHNPPDVSTRDDEGRRSQHL